MSRYPYEVSTSISKEFQRIHSFWNIKRLFDRYVGYEYVKVMSFIIQQYNTVVYMKIYDGYLMSQNGMEDNCMIVYRAFKLS